MADVTDVLALPFPEGSDANDVPADMQALATRLDEAPGIESLTGAEIAALGAALKPAGRVVFNSTTSKLQVSNGTTFADIDAAALLLAGGTMAGNIAMGNNKVTGLAAASGNGEAVRYEQALLLAGGTMAGNIAMGGQNITGLADGSSAGDAVNKGQLDLRLLSTSLQTGYITVNATTGSVTFSPAFGSQPVVTATPVEGGSNFRRVTLTGVTSSGFTWLTDVANGSYISWIALDL